MLKRVHAPDTDGAGRRVDPIFAAASGRVYDRLGPSSLPIPAAVVWLAVLWFLSRVDASTHVVTLMIAWLVFAGAQATMWATLRRVR